MLKKHLGFSFIFALIFFTQLMTESETITQLFLIEYLHYFTKPLIVISLLVILTYHTGLRGRYSKRIGLGLFFGLIGDVLLLLDDMDDVFFIYGLIAFLLGHLCYASAFYIDYNVNKEVYKKYQSKAIKYYAIFSLALVGGLWMFLGNLRIPVILYAIVISFMGVMAVNRYGRVNSLSFKLVFIGSILFVVSDAVLAIAKFAFPFSASGAIVMSTYMLAQYMITFGNIERKIRKKVEEIH